MCTNKRREQIAASPPPLILFRVHSQRARVGTHVLDGVEGDLAVVAGELDRLDGQGVEEDDVLEHPHALVEGAARVVRRVGILREEILADDLSHLHSTAQLSATSPTSTSVMSNGPTATSRRKAAPRREVGRREGNKASGQQGKQTQGTLKRRGGGKAGMLGASVETRWHYACDQGVPRG